jgi:hypothetical protein
MLLRYLPLLGYLGFISVTWIIYFIGPVRFVDFNILLLLQFKIPLIFLTCIGFMLGVKGRLLVYTNRSSLDYFKRIYLPIVYLAAIVLAVKWLILLSSNVLSGWQSFGDAYHSVYEDYERGSAQLSFSYIFEIIQIAFISFSALICIASSFEPRPIFLKRIMFFVIFSFVAIPLLENGKMKYVGDFFIFYFAMLMVAVGQRKLRISLKMSLKVILAISLFIAVLAAILSSRYSVGNVDLANVADKIHPLMNWRDDSILIYIFGDIVGFGIGMLSVYLTNGMYGLSICLSMPFEWTYMFGSSYSLGRIVEYLVGQDISIVESAYPMRAEAFGWGMDKWHTVYAWIASDYTFPGALIVAFLVAFFYGRVWLRVLQNSNPAAPIMFILLTLGMVFSLANNQLLHSLAGCFLVIFTSLLYLICGRVDVK